jgi:UDP-glucose 4-epimerase
MSELSEKRILITGAAGFVGSNLIRRLLKEKAAIHAIVRPETNLWRLAEPAQNLTFHRLDLVNREQVLRTVELVQPQIVFHLAVERGTDLEKVNGNILGTFHLLEATSHCSVERWIHISSSLEYGKKKTPMREFDLTEPDTLLGATKAAATILCQQFTRSKRLPILILRLFSVYGYWEGPKRLIPTIIRSGFRNAEIRLTAPGFRRDFIFIEDVMTACLLASQKDVPPGEIINIASGYQTSNEEVVEIIEEILGKKLVVKTGAYPARETDTAFWVGDPQKAWELLRWKTETPLRTGLEKTVEWLKLHDKFYDAAG